MKVKFWLVVFLISIISGCGGGGKTGSTDTNSNSENTSSNPEASTPGTTNPSTDPGTTDPGTTDPNPGTTNPGTSNPGTTDSPMLFLGPIAENEYVEKINILVNQDFAADRPDISLKMATMVDNLNVMLAKNPENKKRIVLKQVILYPDADFNHTTDNVSNNRVYFTDNNFAGNPKWGGTTLLFWMYMGSGQLGADVLPKRFVETGGGTGYSLQSYVDSKTYAFPIIAYLGSEAYLFGSRDQAPKYVNGLSAYDANLSTVAHEMIGHPQGAGVPEGYSLEFSDQSGVLPNLGTYSLPSQYPNDPMNGADVLKYNIREYWFSPYNSWLITHNANHQYNLWQIADAVKTMNIYVKVLDASGNPVSGAVVGAYGAVKNMGPSTGYAVNMASQLEALTTDVNGKATLTNDFATKWYAKGIKASSAGKYGGAVLTAIDLQMTYWMQRVNDYTLTIQIQ